MKPLSRRVYRKFRPGSYYIGDPSYVLKKGLPDENDVWYKMCDYNEYNETIDGEVFTAVISDTSYGDGVYEGSNDIEYGVDSGCLGVVPVELCGKEAMETYEEFIDDFPQGLTFFAEDGLFFISGGIMHPHVIIQTKY